MFQELKATEVSHEQVGQGEQIEIKIVAKAGGTLQTMIRS